jgi:hypothetical protein
MDGRTDTVHCSIWEYDAACGEVAVVGLRFRVYGLEHGAEPLQRLTRRAAWIAASAGLVLSG